MRFFSDFPFFHGHSLKNTECESSRVFAREHFHEAYTQQPRPESAVLFAEDVVKSGVFEPVLEWGRRAFLNHWGMYNSY